MSKQVFISYSRHNQETMRRLARAIKSKGFSVWTDDNLTPGTRQWKIEIEKAIEASGAVIAMMSPSAKKSEWVDRELEYARMRSITIIPMLIEGDPINAVPFELATSQWIDISKDEQFETGLTGLLDTLHRVFDIAPKSSYQVVREEIKRIASQIKNIRWIGVFTVDGLTHSYVVMDAAHAMEEDRVTAMTAANLSLGERISSELNLGGEVSYTVIAGSEASFFNLAIGDSDMYRLCLSISGSPPVDEIIDLLKNNESLEMISTLL